jgi:energy-coupling factor transport system ATP-binding protein
MNNYIEINNVSFSYINGKSIFKDFSLKLDCEETTILTGKNGSGKTTLSKLIVGVLKPQLGDIMILGESSKSMSLGRIGELIGYVYQYPERQLFAQSVIDELTFPLIFKGMDKEIVYAEAEEMIKLFELDKVKNSYPFFLSYGEKRRLAIASVLMNKPKYLIMDEPTASLDNERIESLSLVLDMLKEKRVGVLIISHNKDFIENHGQRILHIEGGNVVNDINCKGRSSS